jgi:hypothetical protein
MNVKNTGIEWRYVQAFYEYPSASGHNKPWALCTERVGGRTLAKQWHCYQNKVNPVPNKTDKRTITVKMKLLKTSFPCRNIKKHVPSFDTASTKDALYTVKRQLHTSQ